jgi:hypothetical protein
VTETFSEANIREGSAWKRKIAHVVALNECDVKAEKVEKLADRLDPRNAELSRPEALLKGESGKYDAKDEWDPMGEHFVLVDSSSCI